MAKEAVLKSKDLQSHNMAQLKEILKSKGHKTSGNKDELIERVVETSYPIYPLPRARETSVRGMILSAYVDKNGHPQDEAVNEEALAAKIVASGKTDAVTAAKYLTLYKWNLVRYYGYTFVEVAGLPVLKKRV